MCQSLAAGGRRCPSSHRAVRAVRAALTPELEHDLERAGAGHPAAEAYYRALQEGEQARAAARDGEDELAEKYAERAQAAAAEARDQLARGPIGGDALSPEHRRAAQALADSAGNDAVMLPGGDGSQTVAWGQDGFSGAATVFPGAGDDGHPRARLVFDELSEDRYNALARSPWPYRTENGQVLYDSLPAHQAEQVIAAARTGRPGRPWERYGLDGHEDRNELDEDEAELLEHESRAWADDLEDRQHDWMRRYSDDDFEPINAHLRYGLGLDRNVDGLGVPMREVTSHMDVAIAAAGEADEPHRLYRGITPPSEVLEFDCVDEYARDHFVVGQTYRDLHYGSASHDPASALMFTSRETVTPEGEHRSARHFLVFEEVTRKGAAMAALSLQDNEERERLLPRDMNWLVVGVHKDVNVAGENCVVVQLVDVDEIHHY